MKHVSLLVVLIFVSIQGFAQHLTISTSGETGTSGTNWSIVGNTLTIASSGSAGIHPSVITNHLLNIGDLTINLPWQSGVARTTYINNTIAYTGSSNRTLTFNSANDIIFASSVSISSTNSSLNLVFRTALNISSPDNGLIQMNNISIITNGGHLWMGGGPTTATWNGLTVGNSMARTWADDIAGISIMNSTINTNGGNFYMYGRSHNSVDDFGSSNFGVNIENSSISSTSGSITIYGDVLGRYTNGIGTRISSTSSTTTISATSGSINIGGWGSDQTTNGNGWRLGSSISGTNSTFKTIIKSLSGAIFVEGNANFTATINDKEGIVIGGFSEITSQSGNISVKGTNSLESSGQYSNSIRFVTSNTTNSIKIGFDGTNSYSGNIIIEGNSIYQRDNNPGSGSISIQSTGSLTIQPTSASFSYLRAGNSGALTFDDDWNFGTTLSSFTYGKTTNTANITFSNSITTSGAISVYGGTLAINDNFTTSLGNSAGDVLLKSTADISLAASKSLTTNGGDVILWSDSDANNNGLISLLSAAAIQTNGGKIVLAGGLDNGSNAGIANDGIPDGYARGVNVPGITTTGSFTLNSGSGDIFMKGSSNNKDGILLAASLTGTIVSTSGNIDLLGFVDNGTIVSGNIQNGIRLTGGGLVTIESNIGTIKIVGEAPRYGLGFGVNDATASDATTQTVIKSANTTNNALSIKGTGGHGVSFRGFSIKVYATAALGGITIDANSPSWSTTIYNPIDILAVSGPINWLNSTSTSGFGIFNSGIVSFGSKSGVSGLTTSSSAVNLFLHNYTAPASTIFIGSTGQVKIQGVGGTASFGQAFNSNIFGFNANAQTMSGFTFGSPNNIQDLTFNQALSASGPITAYGGAIAVNSNLTSTLADAPILMKATAGISTAASVNITTNKGDLIFWSDSDNTSGGAISIGDNNIINTSNGLTTSGLSGGGTIVLAGGLDNGANGGTSNDGIPDGFASNSSNVGINLGTTSANYTQLYSGGGDILLRANSTASGTLTAIGLFQWGKWLANSGQGAIDINGKAVSFYGINFTEPLSNVTSGDMHLQLISAKSSGTAISINGSSTNLYGVVFNYNNPKEILATGGGDIIVNGTGGGAYQGIFLQNQDILASAGNITMNAGATGFSFNSVGTRIGSKTGSTITSSTANVKLIANAISPNVTSINTSGTFTFEPFGNSFTNPITYPISNITFGSTVSGLTLGKATNTQNITIGGATSIAGPITAYGGSIAVTAAISASGDILLDGDNGNFLTQNTKGVTIDAAVTTSNNGNITILGKGGSGTGYSANHGIDIKNKVEAGGTGNINIVGYGGLSSNGTSSSCHGVNLDVANAWVKSNGGNVTINGFGGGASAGSYSIGVPMQNSSKVSAAGAGTVTITGTGGVNTVAGLRGVVIVSSGSVYSAGGAITITGINGTNGTDYSDGVYFDNAIIGSNASGAITISGQAGTGISNAILMNTTNTIGGASHANNIVLRGNNLSFAGTNSVLTTGQVTIEPYLNSFTSSLTFPIANLSLANTVSGLTIGKPTNTQNITIGGATSIAGPISIYGGTVALNENIASSNGSTITLLANTLTIPAGKTVTSNNGQLIVAPQNTASSIGLAGATGTLSLPAAYFTTNFTDGFSNIQIGTSNHSSAITANAFTLKDNMSLLTTGALTLGGIPVLGGNNLTLGSGITNITSGSTNYFQTNGNGKVIRTIPTGSNLLFPVGKSSYNPVSIKNTTGTSDVFSVKVIDAVYLNGADGTTVTTPVVNRTWDISKTNANAGSGVDFVFNWNANEVANGTLTTPYMNHFTGSVWEVPTVTSTIVGSDALTVVGYTGTFSPFTIAEGSSALPVELTSFNTNCTEVGTEINWQTASEHNSATFEVAKSRDGSNWSVLETVQAAGNSTTTIDYSIEDAEQVSGVVYYRLNQVDQDGASKIYGPISANCNDEETFTAIVYPNPASGIVTIEMNAPVAQSVSIQICGTDGKAIVQIANTLEAGTTQIPLSLESLKAGVYTIKVQGENSLKTIKLVVQ
jgi:hypothetical protein